MSTIDDTVLAGIADRTTTLVPTAAHAADDDGHHSGRHYAGHDDHDDEDGSQEGLRSYAIVAALVVVLLVLVGMLFLVSGLRGSDGGGETAADSGDIAVPRVVGMPQADAQAALAQVDLVAAVETVADDSAPAGTVIDQNPGADESLAAGSSVTLTVSSGPEALTVPDLAGRTQDEAAQIVTDMGLLPSPTQVESQTVPEGMVIGTNPAAGTPTTRGTTIEIQVSARPSATGVPDVTGQPEAQARATLEAAGFQVTVTDQPTRRRRRDGMVLGQNPAGGTPVQIGSPVEIVVGRADGRDDDWPFDFDFDNNG
jgi:serine/threonine-protein kinase